ncbi:MAG: hypothetical protein KGI56_07275, partial [Acidobacteriota bacterium]|nr:hypothetical protein [Acidobacteriota bacterium]
TELSEPPPAPEPLASARPRVLLLVIALVALAGGGAYRMWRHHRSPAAVHPLPVPPAAPVPSLPAPPPPVQAPPPAAAPASAPTPQPAVHPPPAPPPAKPVGPASRAERLKAITTGQWALALAQGEAQRRAIHGAWTLRLEIACQGATVQHAADLLAGRDPDLFLLPMTLRDGRTCYQVFLGSYPSEARALRAARRLPAPFHTEGNRPKPFRVSEIPRRQ